MRYPTRADSRVGEPVARPSTIRITREGARIFLAAAGVDRECLTDIAFSFEPAPTEPPRLAG